MSPLFTYIPHSYRYIKFSSKKVATQNKPACNKLNTDALHTPQCIIYSRPKGQFYAFLHASWTGKGSNAKKTHHNSKHPASATRA